MTELGCTPGQTVGPFLGLGLPYPGDSDLVGDGHPHAVRLHGTVYDGAGEPVPDALIELWQPDAAGRIPRRAGSLRRDGTAFTGWGRSATDAAGHYGFTTVAPGSVDAGASAVFRHCRLRAGAAASVVHPRLPAPRRAERGPTAGRRRRRAAGDPGVRRRKRLRGIPFRHPPAGPERDRVPLRTGTTGDDQSVVAGRPAGRRAHDGSGAAARDGCGGVRLAGRPGRHGPGARRMRRRGPVEPAG